MSPLYFGRDPRLVSRGFHQMFSEVITQNHQLMNVDPRGSTYMALAFLVRGSASIGDVNRNISQLRKKLKLLPFNEDAFKTRGMRRLPPAAQILVCKVCAVLLRSLHHHLGQVPGHSSLEAIASRSIPSIRFELDTVDGGTFNIILDPQDFAEVKGSDCAFAFQPVDLPPNLGPMWVFGQTALRKYYTIYDAKKWWVGIGQNVPSNSGMGVVSMHKTTKAWQSIRLRRGKAASCRMESRRKKKPSRRQERASAVVPFCCIKAENIPAPQVCEDDNKNMVWNHLPGCKSFASMGYCHRFSPLASGCAQKNAR
eukprot:g28949.t1